MKLSSATEVGTQYQWSAQSDGFFSLLQQVKCVSIVGIEQFLLCAGENGNLTKFKHHQDIFSLNNSKPQNWERVVPLYMQTIIDLRINFEHHALHLHLIKFVWLFLLTSSSFKSACMYISNESNCLINYVKYKWVRRKKEIWYMLNVVLKLIGDADVTCVTTAFS